MTEHQVEISVFLEEGAGEIANVFKAGAMLRNDDAFPARGYFVAHAAREIINKLPEYYSAQSSAPETTESHSKHPTKLRDLAKTWLTETGSQISTAASSAPMAEPPSVAISMDLAVKINALVIHETGVKDAVRRRFAAFLGRVRGIHADEMMEMADAFVGIDAHGRAHVPAPSGRWAESKALDVWDQLEKRLHALVGSRHEIYAAIDVDADELNAL